MVKKDNKPLYKPFKAPKTSKYKKMVYVMKDNKNTSNYWSRRIHWGA